MSNIMSHSEIKHIRYFENVRWGDTPKCAYCNSSNLWDRRTDHRFKCRDCNNTFSVTTKTHLHNTKMPLEKWLKAFSIVADAKKKVSAKEFERQLNVAYPTAFLISQKIRNIAKDINLNIVDEVKLKQEILVKESMLKIKVCSESLIVSSN